jgi:hypothetical protein
MNAVTLREAMVADAKRHLDVLKASPPSLSGATKVFTGEVLTEAEDRVLAGVRAAEVEYEHHVDALHRMHVEQIAAVPAAPVLALAPAADLAAPESEIGTRGSQFQCTVDPYEVQELLHTLEHVILGPDGLIAQDGKAHTSATRTARRLEELAVPIFRALTLLTSTLEESVLNLSVSHPQLAAEIHDVLTGVTTTLLKGVIVAKRQSSDVSLSVHVPLAVLDTFRGTLSSSASKEEVKFLKKFKEAAAKAKE